MIRLVPNFSTNWDPNENLSPPTELYGKAVDLHGSNVLRK